MDKLNLLQIFIAVVDRGSFVSAAATLGLSPSAVSKAISRLEQELQVQLIFRTTRSITLTTAGSDYAAQARRIILELEDCENRLRGENSEAKGSLRINLPVSYGRQYIVPLLKDFNAQYPDISLNLSFDDGYVDMVEHAIDITIRTGTLDDSSLVARQLSPMDFLVCASPEYLKLHKNIHQENFNEHPWVRFRFRQSGRLNPVMIKKSNRIQYTDPGQQFVVDDGEAAASLCAKGLGLAQLPHFVARQWLDNGQLVVVTPYVRAPQFGVWLIYAKREFLPARIRYFVEFVEHRVRALGETPKTTWAQRYV